MHPSQLHSKVKKIESFNFFFRLVELFKLVVNFKSCVLTSIEDFCLKGNVRPLEVNRKFQEQTHDSKQVFCVTISQYMYIAKTDWYVIEK